MLLSGFRARFMSSSLGETDIHGDVRTHSEGPATTSSRSRSAPAADGPDPNPDAHHEAHMDSHADTTDPDLALAT